MGDFSDIVIPKEAVEAIQRGVERGDWISEMEHLDLPIRVINLLEEGGIPTLKELMSRSRRDLLKVNNLSDVSVRQILLTLSVYHRLDAIKKREEDALRLRYESNKTR
jgi:DNA-directed RNA polymerase alpha subunit